MAIVLIYLVNCHKEEKSIVVGLLYFKGRHAMNAFFVWRM